MNITTRVCLFIILMMTIIMHAILASHDWDWLHSISFFVAMAVFMGASAVFCLLDD